MGGGPFGGKAEKKLVGLGQRRLFGAEVQGGVAEEHKEEG